MDKLPKIYERIDLLKVFDNSDACSAGTFQAESEIKRSRADNELPLPPEIRINPYEVSAPTVAYWSEGLRLLLVIQDTDVSDGGRYRLPHFHPFRDDETRRQVKTFNAQSSADIAEKYLKLAAEWRTFVRESLPEYVVKVRHQTKPMEEGALPVNEGGYEYREGLATFKGPLVPQAEPTPEKEA